MKAVEGFFKEAADLLWGNWMLYLLLGLGIFYTAVTGFVQLRALPHLKQELFGKNRTQREKKPEALSSMEAMCTAIASCVGSGNIVGVATALISGGPGALFWMWTAAFFGMATKYGEIVLGLLYREQDSDNMYLGGPMYYIAKGLHAPVLGAAAALLLFVQNAGATLIQSNTISSAMKEVFQVPKAVTALVLALSMSLIVKGGLKRLADTAKKIVPFMAGFYIISGIVVVLCHIDMVLPMIQTIFESAFSFKAGLGAAGGIAAKGAMRYGIARGLYSNEAGEGSGAVVHSSAWVDHPSRQGFYGITEVFIDTMVICSTTGFAVLVSGVELEGANAAALTASAFATVFPAFKYIVTISLVLFAATSIMSQWYFGHVSLTYLKSRKGDRGYKLLFPVLILFGSMSGVSMVWDIQDCMLGLLILPNVLALVVLAPKVRRTTREFFQQYV